LFRTDLAVLARPARVERSGPSARHGRLAELDLPDLPLGRQARRDDGRPAARGEGEGEEARGDRFGIDKHGKLVYP
jgi:hypothetical protein